MSGPRITPDRLPLTASLFLVSLVSSSLGCTERTPNFCDSTHQCAADQTCSPQHACVIIPDAARDTARVDGGDAPVADAPGTDEGDHPGDVARGDAGDGGDGSDARPGCGGNGDCTADSSKPICQTGTRTCVGCVDSGDCKDPQSGVCDQVVNRCVACLEDTDCTDPTHPICDAKSCRACKVDAECAAIGPGVCMAHLDGHCATNDETVYVLNRRGTPDCSDTDPAAGTSGLPYCSSQNAIDATLGKPAALPDAGATDAGGANDAGYDAAEVGTDAAPPTKTLVVMRGSSLSPWSYRAANRTLTVVGQASAVISPGGDTGIHVSAGTVYLRSLRVSLGMGTTAPAIVADGGELHLDRCMIDGNAGGGVLIDGAAYDVTNSVIAKNAATGRTTPGCGGWGGVCIAHASPSPRRFLNNTVVENMTMGIACDANYPVLGSIVVAILGGSAAYQCVPSACCSTGDPALNPATYRLTATSTACMNKLDPASSTAYDIDGQPRPFNLLSDCGASEFIPPTP